MLDWMLYWEIFINLAQTIVIYFFLARTLTVKRNSSRLKISMAIVFFTVCVTIVNYLSPPLLVARIIYALLDISFALIFFSSNAFSRVFWGLIPSVVSFFSDSFTFFIISFMTSIPLDSYEESNGYRILLTFIYLFFVTISLFIISLPLRKKNSYSVVFSNLSVFLTILIFISTCWTVDLLIDLMVDYQDLANSDRLLHTVYLVSLLFYVVLIVSVTILWLLGREKQRNMTYALTTQKRKMEHENLEEVKKAIDFLRMEKHELRDRQQIMLSLLDAGKNAELRRFIHGQIDSYERHTNVFYTGNVYLDALLSSKMTFAKDNKITLKTEIFYVDSVFLDDISLCSLVGNMINNAIESCMKIENTPDRYIHLQIIPASEMLCIRVVNASNGLYIPSDKKADLLMTSKKNPSHGQGLSLIANLAKKGGGFFLFQALDDQFTATVMLPTQREKGI